MGGGDALAQTVIERRSRDSYRYDDTARFAFLGVVYVVCLLSLCAHAHVMRFQAPVVQMWYIILQCYVGGSDGIFLYSYDNRMCYFDAVTKEF